MTKQMDIELHRRDAFLRLQQDPRFSDLDLASKSDFRDNFRRFVEVRGPDGTEFSDREIEHYRKLLEAGADHWVPPSEWKRSRLPQHQVSQAGKPDYSCFDIGLGGVDVTTVTNAGKITAYSGHVLEISEVHALISLAPREAKPDARAGVKVGSHAVVQFVDIDGHPEIMTGTISGHTDAIDIVQRGPGKSPRDGESTVVRIKFERVHSMARLLNQADPETKQVSLLVETVADVPLSSWDAVERIYRLSEFLEILRCEANRRVNNGDIGYVPPFQIISFSQDNPLELMIACASEFIDWLLRLLEDLSATLAGTADGIDEGSLIEQPGLMDEAKRPLVRIALRRCSLASMLIWRRLRGRSDRRHSDSSTNETEPKVPTPFEQSAQIVAGYLPPIIASGSHDITVTVKDNGGEEMQIHLSPVTPDPK